ncbi:hypothetical protein [Klebsiella aerogenes]|uniref:fimbrial protein n=1 Tax=Klebsiella aerogenes TaxID=548 RepID=UPI002FF6CE35
METQNITRHPVTRLSPVCVLASLMLLVMPGSGQAADVTLAVDATVLAGTCDVLINTTGSGQTAAGTATETLTLGEVSSGALLQGLEPGNLKPVTVQLSNCQGTRSGASAVPRVTVSGGTLVAPVTVDKHIFRDAATSTADPRIGIVLALTEHPGAPGTPWTNYVVDGGEYEMTSRSANSPNLNGQTGVSAARDFWIGTSCGTATQCADGGGALTTGNAIAKLTFAFAYK